MIYSLLMNDMSVSFVFLYETRLYNVQHILVFYQ